MRIYYFAEVTLNVMIFGWRLNTQAQAFNCVILTNADIHSSIYAIFHKIYEFYLVGIWKRNNSPDKAINYGRLNSPSFDPCV